MVQQWRQWIDAYNSEHDGDTRILLTESLHASTVDTIRYYEDDMLLNPRAHFPLNFQLIEKFSETSTAAKLKQEIDLWIDMMPAGATPNWVVSHE